jgi:hypothetical protein
VHILPHSVCSYILLPNCPSVQQSQPIKKTFSDRRRRTGDEAHLRQSSAQGRPDVRLRQRPRVGHVHRRPAEATGAVTHKHTHTHTHTYTHTKHIYAYTYVNAKQWWYSSWYQLFSVK